VATFYQTIQRHIPGDNRRQPQVTYCDHTGHKGDAISNFIIILGSTEREREREREREKERMKEGGDTYISCFEDSQAGPSLPPGRGSRRIFEGG
jgi:hypothetical protein